MPIGNTKLQLGDMFSVFGRTERHYGIIVGRVEYSNSRGCYWIPLFFEDRETLLNDSSYLQYLIENDYNLLWKKIE